MNATRSSSSEQPGKRQPIGGPGSIHVVVVNFNTGPWLGRCVQSIINAGSVTVVEQITVVDNDSVDDSLARLPSDSRIQILGRDNNPGFGSSVNLGAAQGDSDYLLIANPDLTVQSDTIDRLVDVFANQPDAGIVGAMIVNADGSEQRASRRREPTPWRCAVTALGLDHLGASGVNIRDPGPAEPLPVDGVSGALLMVRRSCWRELGGFDENYFLHCEDLDLFYRARQLGWQIWWTPSARAVHTGGVSHRSNRQAAQQAKTDSMIRYYNSHHRDETPALLRGLLPMALQLRQWLKR